MIQLKSKEVLFLLNQEDTDPIALPNRSHLNYPVLFDNFLLLENLNTNEILNVALILIIL